MSNYKPVPSGFREIANSPEMSKVTLDVARRMATNAEAVGHSEYAASSVTLRSGWANMPRAGASVHETKRHWFDWRNRILLRTAEAMRVRGRR